MKARTDFDYDDVKQQILIHINEKWSQYDHTKPLLNWLNTIISNQIINTLRNTYYSHVSPCTRCPMAIGEDHCSIFGERTKACKLYGQWEKNKKQKYNAYLPVTIENHVDEVFNHSNDGTDIELMVKDLHQRMLKILRGNELIVYEMLYIGASTEEEVIKKLGLSLDDSRSYKGKKNLRCKRLQQLKKNIIQKAKETMAREGMYG